MMTPRWMKLSIGLISVCGQFASRPACNFSSPASAVRSSHSARRCGSSASDLTVRMPCTVSTITEPLRLSASVSLPMIRRSAGKNSRMIPAIATAQTSTIHASVGSIQNRNGSRITSVNMSRKVPMSFPVRNSRIFQTWATR